MMGYCANWGIPLAGRPAVASFVLSFPNFYAGYTQDVHGAQPALVRFENTTPSALREGDAVMFVWLTACQTLPSSPALEAEVYP